VPIYLAAVHSKGALTWLGVTGVAMGWPLYLLAAWFTYLLLAPVLKEKREQEKAAAAAQESPADSDVDIAGSDDASND
jgi:hypothetical protein